MDAVTTPSRADVQRARVVHAAEEIFSRRGYRGTSMAQIADEVGLRKPSLYHYFRSKEELLVHLYEAVARRQSQGGEGYRRFRADCSRRSPPLSRRARYLHLPQPWTPDRLFEEESELPAPLEETPIIRRRSYEDIFVSIVDAALGSRRASFGMSSQLYLNACLGAANWVYKWYNAGGALSPEGLGDQIAELYA